VKPIHYLEQVWERAMMTGEAQPFLGAYTDERANWLLYAVTILGYRAEVRDRVVYVLPDVDPSARAALVTQVQDPERRRP
jgi:hypothetical protein